MGDPGKLRHCADAWKGMASALDRVAGEVESATAAVGANWSGAAHDKFAAWSNRYTSVLTELAGNCHEMVGHLEATADYLDEKNAEIHHLYEAIAATAAVGIGLSIVTFGFSDAAAAATAAGEVAAAEGVLAGIGSFLSAMAESMGATLTAFAERWAVAMVWQLGINEVVHTVEGRPLDFTKIEFWTTSINGATATAVMPESFLKDVRFSSAIRGGIAGFGGSVLGTTEQGDPFSLRSLEHDLVAAGVSGGVSQTFDWVWPEGTAPASAPTESQVINPETGLTFGTEPPVPRLVDGNGDPLAGGAAPSAGNGPTLVDPHTGAPLGAAPEPVTIYGPHGEVLVGPTAEPQQLILGGGPPEPGQITVVDRSGQVVGEIPTHTQLLGPDGVPISKPFPAGGVAIVIPLRPVAEHLADKAGETLVEYIFPTRSGREAEILAVPTLDLEGLGPAPVGHP